MALQITLVKAPPGVSMAKTAHVFDRCGGTLGRSESNLWILPDVEKFLSSCHCELLYEAGGYFLSDLSTNGTFLNSAFEPIGKGSKMSLKSGDFFDVGEYRFAVEFIEDQPFGFGAPQPSHKMPVTPVLPDDFFGIATPASSNPFAGGDFLVTDYSSGLAETQDPLAAFDKANKVPSKDIFGNNLPFDTPGYNPAPEKNNFSTSSLVDASAHVDQAIVWPATNRENLIPDDWEDDLLGSGSSSGLSDDPFDLPAFEPPPPVVPRPKNKDFVASGPAIVKAQPVSPPVQPPVVVVPEVKVKPAPKASVAPPIQTAPVTPVATQVAKKNDVLITAMGLNPESLSADEVNEISEKVGLLMREITEGMMQVLRSRTSIKNEFRMNVTTIQPIENNPLKFSVGVDEAIENMFIKKTNAYKKPSEAFREGFQEIGEHQVAMIAGIRHGFEKMMERFNPSNLENQFNKQGKGTVIPGMQKAKYWTNYKDHYESYSDNMESSFQHLFGSDFVTAYEEQLRKLANVRKKNK
ncbi:MAG: type VI secretion system-associated FHA domain protein TagH [Gammaproteobacteria bacterium]|nr:MAG: type VI secretion system-associated FHA domain protein TagH [Gammaproteobacteria bacterium]